MNSFADKSTVVNVNTIHGPKKCHHTFSQLAVSHSDGWMTLESHPTVKNLAIAISFPRAPSNRSPQIALEMTCPILCQFE